MLLGLLAFGCAKPTPPATPAPPAVSFGPPPTEDEAREYARKLEQVVVAGDVNGFARLYRLSELIERSVSDLGISDRDRRTFLDRANKSVIDDTLTPLMAELRAGGRFTLLRIRTVDGRVSALMRVLDAQGSLNYHEVFIVRFPDGEIGAEDIHYAATGERGSQTLRRIVLQLLSEQNRTLLDRLTGHERVYTENMSRIESLFRLYREKKFREVLAVFRALPVQLQKDKVLQVHAIGAAGQIGDDDEYLRQMEAFRTNHSNDPAADFMLMDFFLLKKQYDACLAAIDRIDRAVGGDPYQSVLRGGTLAAAGRYPEARAAIERAIAAEPKLEHAYLVRIGLALKEQNYADTLKWLKAMVEACGSELDWNWIEKDERYARFVKSPQFGELKRWLAGRK